jgi:hypothetical protein
MTDLLQPLVHALRIAYSTIPWILLVSLGGFILRKKGFL